LRGVIADSPNKGDELKEVAAEIEKIALRKAKIIDAYVDGLIKRSEFERTNNRYNKQMEA
jgi:hypothetical protein